MSNVRNYKYFILLLIGSVLMCIFMLLPQIAMGVDYPGYEEGAKTGSEATTSVGLKTDDSQLSFTVPTVINFALKGDGTFEVPTGAYIKNNSVIQIKVASYSVTSKSDAKGVADVTGQTTKDTYQVNVTGNDSNPVPFAVSNSANWAGWVLGVSGNASDTCNLTFTDGKMVNPTGSTWADGAALQEVVWAVTSNV